MTNITRDLVEKLRNQGFDPVVVDKRRHNQIFVDGQLVATHPKTGKLTMKWQTNQARAIVHRLNRNKVKDTRDD